ncbi:hypothetical protein ACFL35_20625 [Candidatus Riflebacteria bacterium]
MEEIKKVRKAYLTDKEFKFLKKLGRGDFSEGIRKAIEITRIADKFVKEE